MDQPEAEQEQSRAKAIEVKVDLGPIRATEEEVRRLLPHLGNHVLSWLRYDVKDRRDIPIICIEGDMHWDSRTDYDDEA